ncbi:MAG: hypothetical protein ACQEXJ_22700 [Myxococcota bacterium]
MTRPEDGSRDAATRRERMENALNELPLSHEAEAEYLVGWLEAQPQPAASAEGDPADLVVAAGSDFRYVTWHAAGAPGRFAELIGAYLTEAGASQEELDWLASAGERLEPTLVGSWMELAADGLDGGWFFPSTALLDRALGYAPDSPVRHALAEWARRSGVQTCVQLRRSVDESRPVTELIVQLPEGDPGHAISLARQAFKQVGAPWFGASVASAVEAGGAGPPTLMIGLAPQGLARVGVLLNRPDDALLDRLVREAEGSSEVLLTRFQGALGVDGPEWVACTQYPHGFGLDLYWVP